MDTAQRLISVLLILGIFFISGSPEVLAQSDSESGMEQATETTTEEDLSEGSEVEVETGSEENTSTNESGDESSSGNMTSEGVPNEPNEESQDESESAIETPSELNKNATDSDDAAKNSDATGTSSPDALDAPTQTTEIETADELSTSTDNSEIQTESNTDIATSTSDDAGQNHLVTATATTTISAATSSLTHSSSSAHSENGSEEDVVLGAASSTIVSGKAVALANILNLVNTNFLNSDGVVLFSNFLDVVTEVLDLRSLYSGLADVGCSLIECEGDHTEFNISNNASIENSLFIEALTGGNQLQGADSGSIETGDAYAGLNLVNIANTNFVDSNYLLVTLNAFDDINNDIVFPNLQNFFSSLGSSGSGLQSADFQNTATIENNLEVDANTGNNTTGSSTESVVTSGDAHTSTNVFNEINSSLVGDRSVSIIFRVHGSWVGEVFGAPDDLLWTTGEDGSIYLFDAATEDNGSGQVSHVSEGELSVEADNNAYIKNDVSVVALTGENAITDTKTALISTGNAFAGANIINVANANVVGRNWILAIVNIFGDFKGNIAFGRPDLWVGEQATLPSRVQNGSELEYRLTVINNGDSKATEVRLTDTFDSDYLEILDSSLPYTVDEMGKLVWDIGEIQPGSAVEISYRARLNGTTEGMELQNIAEVQSRETDNNLEDNTDIVAIQTYVRSRGNGIKISMSDENEPEQIDLEADTQVQISVTRTTPTMAVYKGGDERFAEQSILIKNMDENVTAKSVVLYDTLRSITGDVIRDEVWNFGDILPGEEITIGYNIAFNEHALSGVYTLTTKILGSNVSHSSSTLNGTVLVKDSKAELIASLPHENFIQKATASSIHGADLNSTASTSGHVSTSERKVSFMDFNFAPTAFAASVYEGNNMLSTIPHTAKTSFFDLFARYLMFGMAGIWFFLSRNVLTFGG